MFDFDAGKLLIVGVIALIFIPPKDLPRVLRQVGQFVGKMRRMAADFQGQFMDAMREADMADLRKEAQKLAEAARVDTSFGSVQDHNRNIMRSLESKPDDPKPAESADAMSADAVSAEATSPAVSDPPHDAAFDALRSELRPLVEPEGDDVRATHAEAPPAPASHSA